MQNQGNAFCLKISGKNQGIRLILETIREISGKLCFGSFNKSISYHAEKLARKQILQIMNQLNHSDMNTSYLILKESFIYIRFKVCESNDFSI